MRVPLGLGFSMVSSSVVSGDQNCGPSKALGNKDRAPLGWGARVREGSEAAMRGRKALHLVYYDASLQTLFLTSSCASLANVFHQLFSLFLHLFFLDLFIYYI